MSPSYSIDEYKTCDASFFITESKYAQFKRFCGEIDEKSKIKTEKNQKLKLNIIQKDIDRKGTKEIKITATSYVGVYSIPDKSSSTLIVRPKIGSTAFLQMLHYIDEQNIIIQNILASGLRKSSDFIDIFLHFFIKTTHDLLLISHRKGYNLVQHDLPFIKGRVDYLKTKIYRVKSSNLISCQYFQFNSDTLINKAIKFTLLHIRDNIPSHSIQYYREILKILENVDVSDFILDHFNKITYNRLIVRYKDVIELCKLIIKNQMISLEKGELYFPAFCFNSWNIFEGFIRKILKIYCSDKYEVKKKRYYTEDETIDPDIVLKNKETGVKDLVIDVKYKDYWSRHDYNQINAFKYGLKAKKGMLLYPQEINKKNTKNFFYESFDFDEWKTKRDGYLKDFAQKILNYITS